MLVGCSTEISPNTHKQERVMAIPTVVLLKYVRRCFYHTLREKVGWSDGVSLEQDSLIFAPPECSDENAVPANLGFDRNSINLQDAIDAVANNLLGEEFMVGRVIPFLDGEPDHFVTFEELCKKVQRRLNSMIVRTIGNRVIVDVVSKWLQIDPDLIIGSDPPPKFQGNAAKKSFVADLAMALKSRLPDLDDSLFSPALVEEISEAKTLAAIRDVLLDKVVGPTLVKKMKNLTCIKDGI